MRPSGHLVTGYCAAPPGLRQLLHRVRTRMGAWTRALYTGGAPHGTPAAERCVAIVVFEIRTCTFERLHCVHPAMKGPRG